MEQNSSGR